MNFPTRPHPANVPTLTEVIEFNPEGDAIVQPTPALVESPLLAPDVAFEPVVSLPEPVPEREPESEPFVPAPEPAPVSLPAATPFVASSSLVPLASIPHVNALATVDVVEAEEPEPEVSEAQLSQRILTDVQRQIDSMLEFRLRESMQPLLAQFTETLMQDLRDELSRTMRDVVTRAVAQEVAKLRNNNR